MLLSGGRTVWVLLEGLRVNLSSGYLLNRYQCVDASVVAFKLLDKPCTLGMIARQ